MFDSDGKPILLSGKLGLEGADTRNLNFKHDPDPKTKMPYKLVKKPVEVTHILFKDYPIVDRKLDLGGVKSKGWGPGKHKFEDKKL